MQIPGGFMARDSARWVSHLAGYGSGSAINSLKKTDFETMFELTYSFQG